MGRLMSVAYTIGFWIIIWTAISRILFSEMPEEFRHRKLRYFLHAFVLAFVWPLGLLTENGRKLLAKSLPR